MRYFFPLVVMVLTTCGCGKQSDDRAGPNGTEQRSHRLLMIFELPRFNGTDRPTFEELQKVLGGLPSVTLSTVGEVLGTDHAGESAMCKQVQLAFDPAKTDLGEIAKALGKLGGANEKPVALVWMSQMDSYGEEAQKRLNEELTNVKGIILKQCAGTRIALDEAGGAKYDQIRAAFKKADVPLLYHD